MAKHDVLTVTLSAVTPLFIGGAEPNARAEIRVSSLKGLLRYWYRALDGAYARQERPGEPTREECFFGSETAGQSPCLLRLEQWIEGCSSWKQQRFENGTAYLGYSLGLRPNDRKAIPTGTSFTLRVTSHPVRGTAEARQAWLAALWLLVHIGGIGARSRRGFGSLRVEKWEGWEECSSLPLPCQASTPDEWKAQMEAGLQRLRGWFPIVPMADHTVIAPGARFLLLKEGHGDRSDRPAGMGWELALNDAGTRLQQFRLRRDPDYKMIKAHLAKKHERELRGQGRMPPEVRPTYLSTGPERAAFGLPVTFRYSSLQLRGADGKNRSIQMSIVGTRHDRMASPLFIRIVRLADSYHALFAYLPAPRLGPGEELKDQNDRQGQHPWRWPGGAKTIVQRFLDERVSPSAVEVRL